MKTFWLETNSLMISNKSNAINVNRSLNTLLCKYVCCIFGSSKDMLRITVTYLYNIRSIMIIRNNEDENAPRSNAMPIFMKRNHANHMNHQNARYNMILKEWN